MSYARIFILTLLTMVAFASNSLLCRAALNETNIDAASFTSIRLIAGAMMLWILVRLRRRGTHYVGGGTWLSALSLFAYAAGFSFAYVSLPAGIGALLLFGAVQATMISYGIWSGERLLKLQIVGLILAIVGVIALFLPGITAPPVFGSILMLVAGIAWGVYSIRGKGVGDPIQVTAGNFLLAVPITILLSLVMLNHVSIDYPGFWYAVCSGAVTSGMGYAIWYTVLPALKATSAATVQLSVPVIAALGGIIFLSEPITLRLILASVSILGGIALVVVRKNI